MKHEINFGPFPMPEAAQRRAQAALKMAITVHNAAIEEAARIAEGAPLFPTSADTARHIGDRIRKLKRAP